MLNRAGGRVGGRRGGRRADSPGPPVACPVCSCERFDELGNGIQCVCHSCGQVYSRGAGRLAFLELLRPGVSAFLPELLEPLTGDPGQLELGDVLTFLEDPDARPYLWDLEP